MTLATLASWASTYLVHPLTGLGYQFWSGIGSDFGELSIVAGAVMLYRRHNCHHRRCPWLQWHVDPDTGHPVCRRHHPDPHGYLTGSVSKPRKG